MRHGIAVEREGWRGLDADRPLTERGAKRVAQVAFGLEKLAIQPAYGPISDVVIRGKGGHGAKPNDTIDPIVISVDASIEEAEERVAEPAAGIVLTGGGALLAGYTVGSILGWGNMWGNFGAGAAPPPARWRSPSPPSISNVTGISPPIHEENAMNRSELIRAMATKAPGISRAALERALEAFLTTVQEALRRGERVTLVGFGTFAVSERAARTGRNPRSGAALTIPARKAVRFAAGAVLKRALAERAGAPPAGEPPKRSRPAAPKGARRKAPAARTTRPAPTGGKTRGA